MIDIDPNAQRYTETGIWGRVSLDSLFKRNLARSPDRLALVDDADKEAWSGVSPLRLTYRQADLAINALAARFQELALKPGSVVGLQLPNTTEATVAMLGVQRAGLVPALLPLLWRSRDIARALEPLAPRALVTVTRYGDETLADVARYAAAELFSVRLVFAFGRDCPDGVVSLDDCFAASSVREPRAVPTPANPGDAPALVTFRTTTAGHTAVARTHNHCVAVGLGTVLEARMEPGEVIASTIVPASIGALAAGCLPWLLTGGTLVALPPHDPSSIAAALSAERAVRVVVPGSLIPDVAAAVAGGRVKSLLALYSDARSLDARTPTPPGMDTVDLANLDEFAVVALRRRNGQPAPIPARELRQPSGSTNGPVLVELRRLASGRLSLRGPMTPWSSADPDGFRECGLVVAEREGDLVIERRSDGVAFIGGLAVATDEIAGALVEAPDVDAADVTAVPDPIFGERLEARIAPRVTAPAAGVVQDNVQRYLTALDVASYKIPSRIVVDHNVRGEPRAKLRRSSSISLQP